MARYTERVQTVLTKDQYTLLTRLARERVYVEQAERERRLVALDDPPVPRCSSDRLGTDGARAHPRGGGVPINLVYIQANVHPRQNGGD